MTFIFYLKIYHQSFYNYLSNSFFPINIVFTVELYNLQVEIIKFSPILAMETMIAVSIYHVTHLVNDGANIETHFCL